MKKAALGKSECDGVEEARPKIMGECRRLINGSSWVPSVFKKVGFLTRDSSPIFDKNSEPPSGGFRLP